MKLGVSLTFHSMATDPRLIKLARRDSSLTRGLAEHDESVTVGRIASRQSSFSSHRHLPGARSPPKLLKAIREESGAGASGPIIPSTGKEGMRTFDPDVVGIEVVGLTQLHTVPLEALQELLREGEIAVIRVEDVNIIGT